MIKMVKPRIFKELTWGSWINAIWILSLSFIYLFYLTYLLIVALSKWVYEFFEKLGEENNKKKSKGVKNGRAKT